MSLHVVGGVYRERCIFPADDRIYGSGGRAAHALKSLEPDVKLSYFRGIDRGKDIDHHISKIWKVNSESIDIPEMVSFSYYHGLSAPVIRPTVRPSSKSAENHLTVEAESVLQFGMLEGKASVHAERAVFDPQNPDKPEHFFANGSSAREVAYVLNASEARKLTGTSSPDQAANELLKDERVSVVVIKCGADGALVSSRTETGRVSAYETPTVWPIGSGDVFAAVFAHFWLTKTLPPLESARLASRGAAIYCAGRVLPLTESMLEDDFDFPQLKPQKKPGDSKIYLAGPFFTMSQLWLVEEVRTALIDAGFNVFSPYHDVGHGEANEVVPLDIKGIEESDAVIALCDGLDAGTLFEVGFAVKDGTPVVAFGEQTSGESMKMLEGTDCKVFRDFTSAIYHVQWEAQR